MRSRLLVVKCSVWRLVISGIIAAALGASAYGPKLARLSCWARAGNQTASEHCLRKCGTNPTVLDQRNPSDLHTLTRAY